MACSRSSPRRAEVGAHAQGPAWRAGVYGLAVDGSLRCPGLSTGAAAPHAHAPRVSLELARRAELDELWPGQSAHRIASHRARGATMTIDAHPTAGHLMTGVGYGRALIGPGAHTIRLAPRIGVAAWTWRRYLLAQVLPFTAALRDLELMHAGAVVVGGAAVAIVGSSEAGKSTLVAALVAAGAAFLSDDVLAVRPGPNGEIEADPGPGTLVLRESALGLLGTPPGPIVGGGRGEHAIGLPPASTSPLRAVCLVQQHRGQLAIETAPSEDPRPLLSAAYELVRRGPERRRRQLELMADVAASARLLRVRLPLGAAPERAARALLLELGDER